MQENVPVAPTRKEKDKARKQAEILDVAETIFRKKGYQRTTTEEIARESGYAVGTIYNVFHDKQDLYGQVLEHLGLRVFARLDNAVFRNRNVHEAVETLIKLRLYNYFDDRLFFQPFSSDGDLSLPLDPTRLPRRVVTLYQRYLDLVGSLLKRALGDARSKGLNGVHLALSLEGMINAFMGYWSRPEQADSLAQTARHIKSILLNPDGEHGQSAGSPPEEIQRAKPADIHISRFDMERLRELLLVARCFGRRENQTHLDALDDRLDHAKMLSPKEVPADLVTMNTRVCLMDIDSGETVVRTLVFPRDADARVENVSVLDPLGTALLGQRLGESFSVSNVEGDKRYRVEEILYQPEAAGDYHL